MPADQRLRDALYQILDAEPAEQNQNDQDQERRDPRERRHGIVAVHPHNWEDEGYVDYFYRRDTILVRTIDADRVLAALNRGQGTADEQPILRGEVRAEDPVAVIDGLASLSWRFGTRFDAGRAHDEPDPDTDENAVPEVLRRLDEHLGVGVATPDHALSLCGGGHPCPATEPAEVPSRSVDPVPSACCHRGDGRGVVVGVVDSGLIDDVTQTWPWMGGITGDVENPFTSSNQIGPYACHGTFVAGCVRATAPQCDVIVKRAEFIPWRPNPGMAYETEIIRRMVDLLDAGADIIVCEFDGVTRLHLPLRTFELFYDTRMRHLKHVVVVAPAGNDESRLPTFPAAYSWVIGVGALSADERSRASFSNHGGWVDVYARGEDLVNAFASGEYTCFEDPYKGRPRRFDGLAKWSGTSFSAPLVAGMIAARMSDTGENAPRAAATVLDKARAQAVPGIGAVLRLAGCDCGCG